jgi:hypothetical protein
MDACCSTIPELRLWQAMNDVGEGVMNTCAIHGTKHRSREHQDKNLPNWF